MIVFLTKEDGSIAHLFPSFGYDIGCVSGEGDNHYAFVQSFDPVPANTSTAAEREEEDCVPSDCEELNLHGCEITTNIMRIRAEPVTKFYGQENRGVVAGIEITAGFYVAPEDAKVLFERLVW